MKKIIYLFVLASALFTTSCSSDDDSTTPETSNQISFNELNIPISRAIVEDFGPEIRTNYYNYDFTLIGTDNDIDYELYMELFSPITGDNEVFTTGTFIYTDFVDVTEDTGFHFSSADLFIDDQIISATAGDITVSGGNDNNFTIVADLTLPNNEVITLSYSGSFEFFDER